MQPLAKWTFGISGLDAAADLRGDLTDFAPGSQNLLPDGVKQSKPFRGLTANGIGARLMFQCKDSFGGLDDVGANRASGSLFSTIADMLIYCGSGQVMIEVGGVLVAIPGAIASNILKYLLKWNGSYTDPMSGPYAAGLPEPAAISIGVIESGLYGTSTLNGTVSVKYARLSSITGDKSRASPTSAVAVVSNKHLYAVVPLKAGSQDRHIFFRTDDLLGGIGPHYRISRANPFTQLEYTEDDVERTVTITSVSSSTLLNGVAGTFTAADIGKRVSAVSGLTIPNPTTITEIISSSQVRLSNAVTTITGAKVVKLIAFAAGIDRSVVLSSKQSDLVEETAWIYDFPPRACSHAFQLENRLFIAAFADTRNLENSASSTNPGTALLPSIPNNFGSYDPRFPIYLPEQVVDILGDGQDSYKFIGGRNGIYAIQYLNITNGTPATLTVLLRGMGIKNPGNWCARESALYLMGADGQPVRIIGGGRVDKSFAGKIRLAMKDWTQENTVLSGHPKGGGVIYSHFGESYFFEEASGRWSTELSLNDSADGNAISGVATQSRSLLVMENNAVRTAHWFDEGSGSFICGTGHYQDEPAARKQKVIQRVKASAVCDRLDKNLFLAIHANTLQTYVKTGAIEAGTNVLTATDGRFMREMVGSYILIKGAGSQRAFFFARIKTYISPTEITLGTPVADLGLSQDYNVLYSVESAYCLIGLRIFPVGASRTGTIEIQSPEIELNNLVSYAASVLMETLGSATQPLDMEIEGFVNFEEGWTMPSSTFAKLLDTTANLLDDELANDGTNPLFVDDETGFYILDS